MRYIRFSCMILVVLSLLAGAGVLADTHAGEQINWHVLSSGGNTTSSTNYRIAGTLGQVAVGQSASTTYSIKHGFWQTFEEPIVPCCGIYNDGLMGNNNCSTDGKLTLSDVTTLIDHIYITKNPLCCYATGNTNSSADCKLTLSDITALIDVIYITKNPPDPCMLECER